MVISVCIILIGICSYILFNCSEHFRGSSAKAKSILTFMTSLGYISLISLSITSFFYIKWWIVLISILILAFISGLFSKVRNPLIGLFSFFVILVFNFIAWHIISNLWE